MVLIVLIRGVCFEVGISKKMWPGEGQPFSLGS
jgi:hypothetical protein